MVEYSNDKKYAYFNGMKFTRDKKTNYYLSASYYKDGKRVRLHRYVWECFRGIIPDGYDIHHKDHNKFNNEIDNLELLSKEEHQKRHSQELSEETRERYRKNLNENARPKAIEWHKSKQGSEWHKEQYKISLGNLKPTKFICDNCGKEFEAINHGKNRFCSNNCKSQYRRKSGVDDVIRKCIVCGDEFKVNKYSKKVRCNNC